MLGTNMINNGNGSTFQEAGVLESSEFSCLFDLSDKDDDFGRNVFYEGGLERVITPMFCQKSEFCSPSNHDMFYNWTNDRNSIGIRPTVDFDMSSESTATSHEPTTSSTQITPPTQYSRCSPPNLPAGLQCSSRNENLPSSHSVLDSTGQQIHPQIVKASQKSDSEELKISEYAMECLIDYSFCVVDNFMGPINGRRVLSEVVEIEKNGLFEDGRLVSQERNSQMVRGDKIFWIESNSYSMISKLIRRMDRIVFRLRGSFQGKSITRRTKPMVACYPGLGAAYMRHVDNSNQDGRLITCLYYLNMGWNSERDGGVLRLYPRGAMKVDVEPLFDRLLMFWSDCRNPHEVLPSFKNRYAITVWYFDDEERKRAQGRNQ